MLHDLSCVLLTILLRSRRCAAAGVEVCVRVCEMSRVHARHMLPARTASREWGGEQVYVCVQRCAESCVVWDALGVCGRGAFAWRRSVGAREARRAVSGRSRAARGRAAASVGGAGAAATAIRGPVFRTFFLGS